MTAAAIQYRPNYPRRFLKLFRKIFRSRNLALVLTVASVISVIATYSAITSGENLFGPDPKNVIAWVLIDLILLLALAAVVSKRLLKLFLERRKGSVGSRLQTRIVVMFSLVAIVPTITMAVFSAIFFNYGIQSWFDQKVSTAIEESVKIADLYFAEHKNIIHADILGMASDLNRDAYNIREKPGSFSSKLSLLTVIRKLPEAIVFQKSGRQHSLLARTNLSYSLEMILEDMPDDTIRQAENGNVVIVANETEDRVTALIKLENYFDTYLLVGRFVDNNIIKHIEFTKGAANEYSKLKNDVSSLQIQFFIVFVIVSLLLLLMVVWAGLIFAVAVVKPISMLVDATQKVKGGDLTTRVAEGHENDEIATLAREVNRMTTQLEKQRMELISAQRRSAWSDVARRIAHEIKNPLTPIQLAADRLKNKYSDEVENKEVFSRYINTIIRNVNSIGKMVEEFVSFARIPVPVFANTDICELIEEVIFSREVNSPDIDFIYKKPDKNMVIYCDFEQISRVMTNLLKNAEESIEDKMESGNLEQGIIKIIVEKTKDNYVIKIIDNGRGFDQNILERVTEPYVTTKSKGTGLGLAIVKKIIEDHNGRLEFINIDSGACVYIYFPLSS